MTQGLGISKVLNMSPSAMFRALGSPKNKPRTTYSPKISRAPSMPRVVIVISPPKSAPVAHARVSPLRRKSLPKARNENVRKAVQNERNKVNSPTWRNKAGKAYNLYKELVGTKYSKHNWVNILTNSHVNHAKKKAASVSVKLGMRHAMAGRNVNYIPAISLRNSSKNWGKLNRALHNLH
jgi:hypothetical protein